MKILKYISTCTDRTFNTIEDAFKSGEDFVEGYFCTKCKCTSTTDCNCINN